MFDKVADALIWLENRRFITKGFDAFQKYLETLGNPQLQIPCIHIAGTNGKGSTLHYLSCILQETGAVVGTFSSPYLETHFDRIRINDINIDEDIFLSIVNSHYQEWMNQELNMFEIDFVIASLYFFEKNVDYAIYEVGLGGRLDATNTVMPLASVITNIGMDHMEYLGNTYEKIADAKAGIIKEKIPLITAEKKHECLAVFQKTCDDMNSEMISAHKASNIKHDHTLSFDYDNLHIHLDNTPLYQAANISCAIETARYLTRAGYQKISDEQLLHGIARSHWKGRFEFISRNPLVIIDGAHNKEGIEALCASMQGYEDIHVIFSALKDKNHDAMLETLLTISDDITVCEFVSYRATTCEDLAKQYPVKMEKDYRIAVDQALTKTGTILITGSLYFISDVRAYLKTKYNFK